MACQDSCVLNILPYVAYTPSPTMVQATGSSSEQPPPGPLLLLSPLHGNQTMPLIDRTPSSRLSPSGPLSSALQPLWPSPCPSCWIPKQVESTPTQNPLILCSQPPPVTYNQIATPAWQDWPGLFTVSRLILRGQPQKGAPRF